MRKVLPPQPLRLIVAVDVYQVGRVDNDPETGRILYDERLQANDETLRTVEPLHQTQKCLAMQQQQQQQQTADSRQAGHDHLYLVPYPPIP